MNVEVLSASQEAFYDVRTDWLGFPCEGEEFHCFLVTVHNINNKYVRCKSCDLQNVGCKCSLSLVWLNIGLLRKELHSCELHRIQGGIGIHTPMAFCVLKNETSL